MSPQAQTPSEPEQPALPGKLRTWWHPMLAALFRWKLVPAFAVHPEVNVGVKPLQIDILLIRRLDGVLAAEVLQLFAGIVERLNDYTLVELKGPNDDLRPGDYRTLTAYANLYCAQYTPLLPPSQMTLLVVAPLLTKGYREELQVCQVTPREEHPGIWRLEGPLLHPAWVLETSRLPASKFPLLAAFSPEMLKKPREVARVLRECGHEELLVYVTQQVEQFRKAGEDFAMKHFKSEEMERMREAILDEIRASMTLEERLEGISAEERLKGLPAEEFLKGLPAEERLKGLPVEEMFAALTADQRERLLAMLQQSPKN